MLFSVDSWDYVDNMIHEADFLRWKGRLSPQEFKSIYDHLDSRVGSGEIHTSSWIPGADWTDTPFEPIYTKACPGDVQSSAKFFGLILWKVMLDRPEVWGFGRYEKDNTPIEGMTYFQVSNPPPRGSRSGRKGRSRRGP